MRILFFILVFSASAASLAEEGTIFPEAVWLTDAAQTGQPELLGIDWEQESTTPTLFPDTGRGWLGKRMIRAAAGYAWPAEGSISIWANNVTRQAQMSAAATINCPAPWTDSVGSVFSHDLFIAGSRAESDVNSLSFDLTTNHLEVGTTAFLSTLRFARPFLQLGYRYRSTTQVEERFNWLINPRAGILPSLQYKKITRDEHRLLANVGFEGDISESLSLRCQFDVNAHRGIGNSAWSANLIYWPNDRWNFSIGAFEDMEDNFTGIQMGTGLAF